jgi:hypothetical protein
MENAMKESNPFPVQFAAMQTFLAIAISKTHIHCGFLKPLLPSFLRIIPAQLKAGHDKGLKCMVDLADHEPKILK